METHAGAFGTIAAGGGNLGDSGACLHRRGAGTAGGLSGGNRRRWRCDPRSGERARLFRRRARAYARRRVSADRLRRQRRNRSGRDRTRTPCARRRLKGSAVSTSFCRDCLADAAPRSRRCAACGSPRLLRHGELATLAIAHVDCDAFYATIEKRDDPTLAAEPVIVGGGKRGVVATCCYIARTYGVKSAMPMFEALRLCPQAKVVRPNFEKYSA